MRSPLSACALSLLLVSGTACSGSSGGEKKDEMPAESTTETTTTDDVAADGDTAPQPEDEAPAPAEETEIDLDNADLETLYTVSGNGDEAAIAGVIGQRKPDVYQCYQKELPNSPGLTGRVLVQITTTPTGEVATAFVKQSTLGNRAVETCMMDKIRGWRFPEDAAGGLVIITYPFQLPP